MELLQWEHDALLAALYDRHFLLLGRAPFEPNAEQQKVHDQLTQELLGYIPWK